MISLGLDIGTNSVGSVWIDSNTGELTTGTSIFPAGVDESDDKRGDPKNAKRRMVRRTRITLARRAERKRELRMKLISVGLLPANVEPFKRLLDETDPWELRRKALTAQLTSFEFGRILLHLAQRRGALGLKMVDPEDDSDASTNGEYGKVKAAIGAVRAKMLEMKAETFGEFIAMLRAERVTAITTEDRRPVNARKGLREYRGAIRNKAGSYENCADRPMIRDEFAKLWDRQKAFGGPLSKILTDPLQLALDDETGDTVWRHKGLLFGQRRQSWDLGTLGRCVLEPTERCVPHADMYASRYLVVETVNNLKVIERGKTARPLSREERSRIKDYLCQPLGEEKRGKRKGQPKRTVTVSDLREQMGWGRASKTAQFRFNIESDEDRTINTDWFSREIIHGAVTLEKWNSLSDSVREGINRVILKYDPDEEKHAAKLKAGIMQWAGLNEALADALVAAWQKRPRPDAKRLNMSRRAVRNILVVMDHNEPWPDSKRPGQYRWLTQIEARKLIAEDADFKDATTGQSLDDFARQRYATGAKGATARDRHYMRKHVLKKNGKAIIGSDGRPLFEPPPAPLISNPVVRKSIHEVRRHLVEYMTTFERKPDEIYIELAREAKMGKKDADRLLFKNRLRNRIRNDITAAHDLQSRSSTQQRTAVDRVVLCMQQAGICPLCGNQIVKNKITPRIAAYGEECEVAHIIPRASGGHNGLGNIVLAHTKCNRDMGRRTPRQFWQETLQGGFDEGMAWVEQIYGEVQRPNPKEIKTATGDALWQCYFTQRDDTAKIEQFKKDIKDIQEMTQRQGAATKYAARQVMAYLADALFDGKGLPERGGDRLIYTTDGLWTSRLRREWGLFFDPHDARDKGLSEAEEHIRKEKNRGDHRHHAVDAVIIALCTREVQIAWENREQRADIDGINTADEQAMDNYRRLHPISPPAPFKTREELREAVRRAVFGQNTQPLPICHRPVKHKLIGALHEETLFGPVLDRDSQLTGNFTAKKSVLSLDPNHLRMPRPETEKEAVERLAARRQRDKSIDEKAARKWARSVVSSAGYKPAIVDPPPEKSGIVRDVALRTRLRQCLEDHGLNPDQFTATEIKKLVESGGMKHASGVPIRSVVLLRTMSDPVVIHRKRLDHITGQFVADDNPASLRAYVGGNNHHIEIRADAKGNWSGEMVSAFETAKRKSARLRSVREANIPKFKTLRELPPAERAKYQPTLHAIENAHPIVDRCDDDAKGGKFIISLCEGEMLWMKHKETGEVGYFVVAKLDKPQGIVLVPHWDARSATGRKDADGRKVPNSTREQFTVTPAQLKNLAPPDQPHAIKVRVSPLGKVHRMERD